VDERERGEEVRWMREVKKLREAHRMEI